MKKAIFAISFICYFAATTGIVVNSHYCMKRLVSVHLFESKSKICGRCGMGMHNGNGCCRDEVKVAKLQQDQNKVSIALHEIASIKQLAIIPSDFMVIPFQNAEQQLHLLSHPPPLLTGQDTYLQNRVFRI